MFTPTGLDGIYNPSFDVTPAELVTAIVTEKGVAVKAEGDSIFDLAPIVWKEHTTSRRQGSIALRVYKTSLVHFFVLTAHYINCVIGKFTNLHLWLQSLTLLFTEVQASTQLSMRKKSNVSCESESFLFLPAKLKQGEVFILSLLGQSMHLRALSDSSDWNAKITAACRLGKHTYELEYGGACD